MKSYSFWDRETRQDPIICEPIKKREIMRVPICFKHNPQEQIGKCEAQGDKLVITFDDDKGFKLGCLLDIMIGSIQVLEYESDKDQKNQIIKKFAIKSFIIKEEV